MFNRIPSRLRSALTMVPVLLIGIASASAQQSAPLPNAPGQWINSQPLTNEMLAGKAAFLYYFEEECPTCRGRWPEILQAAAKFAGKPIVFIAVNSGNPAPVVQQYAREVGLTWPVVVDPDRSFEKASGLNNIISLDNIYQVKLLMPDGSLTFGDWSDIEGSANRALENAKWRVDPAGLPAVLKPAWVNVEFGNFAAAAPVIKKSLNTPNLETRAAAEKLQAAVDAEFKKALDAATAIDLFSNKWTGFKPLTALTAKFPDKELPTTVSARFQELKNDPDVKAEAAAAKQWETAQRVLANVTPGNRRTAMSALQRIVSQYPKTEAAQAAQIALDQLNAAP